MNKEIRYTGYTAVPSDYESADGELAMSMNLINEDGHIHSILPPANVLTVDEDHHVLLIHSVPGQENIILLTGDRESNFGLSWIKRGSDIDTTADTQTINTQTSLTGLIAITIVGNTLCVATSGGVHYILWKDNDYKHLGNRPPFIPISFGAYKVDTLSDKNSTTYTEVPNATYLQYSGQFPNNGHMPYNPWSEEDKAFWDNVSTQALALLLSTVAEKVSSNGCLYQPFYIRYAYKLYDGSYSWHSAPILMLVSTHRPIITLKCSGIENGALTIGCYLEIPFFRIAYQILGNLAQLKEWSDIVTGIDVFISAPIYTYNQDKVGSRPVPRISFYDNIYRGGGGTHRGSSSTDENTTNVFIGHYGTSINGEYSDHFITDTSSEIDNMDDLVCPLTPNENFNDKIQNEFLFYKVASLKVNELTPMDKMENLPLLKADLTNLNTLERLEDEYNSHATILPAILNTYNQRLLMGDINIMPPKPFPMSCLTQRATPITGTEFPDGTVQSIKVFTHINGTNCISEITESDLYPFDTSFPRFIYHPDPSAYKMEITANGKLFSIPLKAHPHLNGSFWFGGMGPEPTGLNDESVEPENITATSAPVQNKIYISEINNPFIFPANNIITIPCSRILNLSTAAKPLSQGQFGQFPLYAFTDDGIWALDISATGTISARQPITRDVCTNTAAITPIDSAVLFPTDRGIMLIAGAQTQCISESINTEYPFDIISLPGMKKILDNSFDEYTAIAPFSDYIYGCGMIYDYPHRHIIIFNKDYPYAYIYSLKSTSWGMMNINIKYTINSYPEALAVLDNGKLVDFSRKIDNGLSNHTGILVTRPLKLDMPDVHKTVDSVIQRGYLIANSNVQSVLYGSRDLIHWHPVWSSKDRFMRGFRGTPYKYFRVALLCNLSPDESIYGASVQFAPRLTNQPR